MHAEGQLEKRANAANAAGCRHEQGRDRGLDQTGWGENVTDLNARVRILTIQKATGCRQIGLLRAESRYIERRNLAPRTPLFRAALGR